jgi:hypothetical protein
MIRPGVQRDYEALLNPDELRSSLIAVSLFVLAYESFRSRVIEHVRMLYWRGIDESGHKYDEEEYRRDILTRNRSPFRASLDWFREMGALDVADLKAVETLTQARNRLAHELMDLIGTRELAPELAQFDELARIYRKVEVWQIVNLELATDPEWVDKEINEAEIVPGPMLMMQILTDVALGKTEDAWQYYKAMVCSRSKTTGSD